MTEREAIEELKSYADNSWGSLNESFKLAIQALEKVATGAKVSDPDLMVVEALPSLYPLQSFEEESIHRVVASVREESQHSGWIPCSERLPEKSGKYLVTVKNLTGFWLLENNVFVCDYELDAFIFQGWEDNNVIAWQPLPTPYQPKNPYNEEECKLHRSVSAFADGNCADHCDMQCPYQPKEEKP